MTNKGRVSIQHVYIIYVRDLILGMPVTESHFRGISNYGIKGALIMFLEVKSKLCHLNWGINMRFHLIE